MVASTLRLAKVKILLIERRTTRQAVSPAFLRRLSHWQDAVKSAPTPSALAVHFASFIRAAEGCRSYNENMLSVRRDVAAALAIDGTLSAERLLAHGPARAAWFATQELSITFVSYVWSRLGGRLNQATNSKRHAIRPSSGSTTSNLRRPAAEIEH